MNHDKPMSRPLDMNDPDDLAVGMKMQEMSSAISSLFAIAGLHRGEGMTAISVFLTDNLMVDEVDEMLDLIRNAVKHNHAINAEYFAERDKRLKVIIAEAEAEGETKQ